MDEQATSGSTTEIGGAAGPDLLRALIGLAPYPACALAAPSLELIAANAAYVATALERSEELVGSSALDHHGCVTGLLVSPCQQVLTTGVATRERASLQADGHQRSFELAVSPARRADGAIAGLVALLFETSIYDEQTETLRRTSASLGAWLSCFPDLVFRVSPEGVIRSFEAGPIAELVAPPEAFVGKPIGAVLPPKVTERLRAAVRQALGARAMQVVVYDLEVAGRSQYYEARLVPDRDEVIGIVRNVTSRHRAEQALVTAQTDLEARVRARTAELERLNTALAIEVAERRCAEARLRLHARLLDAVGQAVVATNIDGVITYWNQRAEQMTGWPAPEAVGRHVLAVTVPERRWGEAADIVASVRAGHPWSGEFVTERRDKAVFPIELLVTPIRDDGGQITGGLAVSTDITARKQAEERLRASEELYRALAEAARDAVCLVGDDGRVVYMNRAAANQLGRAPESAVGLGCTDLFEPPAGRQLKEAIDQVVETGVARDLDLHTRLPGRGDVWLSVSLAALQPRDGRRRAVLAVARDVTVHRRAAMANSLLADTSQLLAASALDDAFPRVARRALPSLADGWVLVTNSRAERRQVVAHVDGQREAALAAHVSAALAAPPTWHRLGDRLRRGEGVLLPQVSAASLEEIGNVSAWGPLHALGMASAIFMPVSCRGTYLGTLFVFRGQERDPFDAADLELCREIARRIGDALDNDRLVREAREADSAKDRFLAVISHELRNLMTPVLAATEGLRAETPQASRQVALIERNVLLQARLVSDLLDLSRVTQGKVDLRRRTVALDRVVDLAIRALADEIGHAGLFLETDLERGVFAFVDADRVSQVVTNLVGNAIKFTPRGGQIHVRLARVDDRARIEVTDTGVGFEPADRERIFGLFQQHGPGLGHRGLGIGLALVRSLAELHGGRAWADSAGTGQGSRFAVELPATAGPEEPAPPSAEVRPGRIRLLLVEDQEDTRQLLAEGLGILDVEVATAASGEEALERLGAAPPEERPDILVLDIGLPGMDGFELLERLRAMPELAGVPALALTGYGGEAMARRTRGAGFDGLLPKPIGVAALDRAVRELLAARRPDS